jgi:hypothetical protein
MVSLEVIAILLSGVGITASIFYYANIIQNSGKARQRELVFLRAQTYSMEYTKAYADVLKMDNWTTVQEFHQKYGQQTNPEAFAKWLYVRNVFNLAGLLLQEKGTDPDQLFQLFSPVAIIMLWEKHKPIIEAARKGFSYPQYYMPLEYLYNEARKRYPDIKEYKLNLSD